MFPQLPSGNNPSLGAAAGAGSGAASIFNSLQSALNQASQLKQRQQAEETARAHQAFEDKIKLVGLGAREDADTGSTHPNGPTLKLGDKDQDSARQSRKGTTIKDPQGGPDQYIPSKGEKDAEALNDTNSIVAPPGSQLEAQLQEEAGIPAGTRIPHAALPHLMALHDKLHPKAPSETFEPFNIKVNGKEHTVMKGSRGTWKKFDPSSAFNDPESGDAGPQPVTSAFAAQEKGAIPPGTQLSQGNAPGAAPGGVFSLPEKAERKETADDWVRIMTDPSSDPKEVTRATAALKLWRAPGTEAQKDREIAMGRLAEDRATRLSNEAQRMAANNDDLSPKQKRIVSSQIVSANKVKMTRMQQAEREFRLNLREAGQDVGKVKSAKSRLLEEKQSAQDEFESALNQFNQNVQHVTLSNDPAKPNPPLVQGPPTQRAPQAPTQAPQSSAAQPVKASPAASKKTSLATVRAYAQKNNLSEADAIRKAKAEGYSIGQ